MDSSLKQFQTNSHEVKFLSTAAATTATPNDLPPLPKIDLPKAQTFQLAITQAVSASLSHLLSTIEHQHSEHQALVKQQELDAIQKRKQEQELEIARAQEEQERSAALLQEKLEQEREAKRQLAEKRAAALADEIKKANDAADLEEKERREQLEAKRAQARAAREEASKEEERRWSLTSKVILPPHQEHAGVTTC
jgi:septal ring factor EnvC (AmiA/AmiB activator)